MSPEAIQLRADNNLARLPEADQDRVRWLINAGIDDTRRGLADMTGTPEDLRVLETAIDLERAGENRSSRLKPIQAKLSRFTNGSLIQGDGTGTALPPFDPSAAREAAPLEVLSPESLLPDAPNASLSTVETSALAAVENGWKEARRLADLAKNYSRASTAAKALCGLRLRAIREFYFGPRNPKGGRPKKTPNRSGFSDGDSGKPETVSGFSSWEELIADRVGVTDKTARNWMAMADAVEELADRESLNLQEIITKLPWDWTLEESFALESAVHKITEGRTQKELLALQSDFLSDLGYEAPEKPNGSNNPSGNNGGKKEPAKDPQALLQERREAARLIFLGTAAAGRVEQGSPAMFMANFIATAGQELEALPQAELRDLYEHTVKPFAAAFRKLAAL